MFVVVINLVSDVFCVTVVQSQNDYAVTYTSTQICAFKGSTVDIRCSFKYPSRVNVLKRVWFTKGNNYNPEDLKTDPVYAGRVSYSSRWKSCTLTIRDLRESDSAVYKFRFETDRKNFTGLPGVTLTSEIVMNMTVCVCVWIMDVKISPLILFLHIFSSSGTRGHIIFQLGNTDLSE
uniref:Immunoglobulin subtype domain-containing protein n=1 Tax=Haplochromis burtoni TaxID=8153 RepID=A0A3Q2WXJ4_HAPBU